jgi:hypothetical protein
MMSKLAYTPFEKLPIRRPVVRVRYIVEQCRGRSVLDLGCYDETALVKRDTAYWLHDSIAAVATAVVGLDNSTQLSVEGISTGPRSRIIRGDVTNPVHLASASKDAEVIVAGELVEHLANTQSFFQLIREICKDRQFIASTPNATSLTNCLLAMAKRESCHPDHVQIYSYKTLSTLCGRAGFEQWEIVPYYVRYTEMTLRSRGLLRFAVRGAEAIANSAEWLFPMLAGGLLLHVRKV